MNKHIDKFEISNAHPIPFSKSGRTPVYPFLKMEIGDSFAVSTSDGDLPRVRAAASAFGKAHQLKFRVARLVPHGSEYRCWRIA